MQQKLTDFIEKQPEIVFEWFDDETGAEGWVVINSLRNGAAGGGTRMRKGLDKHEVVSLAKTMEIKFTVSGPAIGGAKSGINFDPASPQRDLVLKKWFSAVAPLLKNYYGTGGDLNIDEIKDVIPITEDLGIWHPQEGIVNGHFQPRENRKIQLIGQLRQGVSKKLEDPNISPDPARKYVVADMITGYGVAESVVHFYDLFKKKTVDGKRVLVQGWGNVAGAAAWYLAKSGAKVVGIIDKNGGLLNEEGLSFEEVRNLFLTRKGNILSTEYILPFEEVNEKIWSLKADIFIPGAASRLVTKNQLEQLIAGGLEVISCGANVPFAESDLFYGPISSFADQNVSLIPDFIANCGMARVFAYLMKEGAEITDEAIFTDVSQTIRQALKNVAELDQSPIELTKKALEIALNQLQK